MQNNTKEKCLDKTDAFDILDRTIDFIRNCENKASILLGTFGVILTILLTTEGINNLKSIIYDAVTHLTFCNILYLIMFATSIGITIYGLYRIIKVLGVEVDSPKEDGLDRDSKIFFEHVRKNKYLDYKNKLQNLSHDEMMNDITSQIYINSCICGEKYSNYKAGLKWTIIGFCGFLALWIIGIIIF